MKELPIIKKNERDKFPNLKTLTELKKEKLMPKPRVKPRAIYEYWKPYGSKPERTYLYDKLLTQPFKLSEKELKKRRLKDKERYYKMKIEKEKNEILLNLENIKPYQTVIFDIETTGLDPMKDEILQISAINEKYEVLINSYVKPEKHSSWIAAERINGISPDMVKDAPKFDDIWEKIQTIFFSSNLLIAYNGEFDLNFLRAYGIKIPKVKYIDVMMEFAPIYGEWSEYYQEFKWQKLTTCAAYYDYDFSAHDSLEDVKATYYCYKKIFNEK